jgi:hypothetical protein
MIAHIYCCKFHTIMVAGRQILLLGTPFASAAGIIAKVDERNSHCANQGQELIFIEDFGVLIT